MRSKLLPSGGTCFPGVARLIGRHIRINLFRPGVDATAQRLRAVESLLAQPVGHAHGADAVMADNDDMFVGIKFLVGAAGDVSHGDQHRSSDFGHFELPGFANVEQGERGGLIEKAL